jgi:hypothetical protein
MEAVGSSIGVAVVAGIVSLSVMASHARERLWQKCSQLDSCRVRQEDIDIRKVRGR